MPYDLDRSISHSVVRMNSTFSDLYFIKNYKKKILTLLMQFTLRSAFVCNPIKAYLISVAAFSLTS